MKFKSATTTTPWMVVACAGGVMALSVSMSGCANGAKRAAVQPPKAALDQPAPWTYTGRPVSEPLLTAALPQIAASDSGPRLISDETLTATDPNAKLGDDLTRTPIKRDPGDLVKVKYTASAAPINDVLQVLMGQMLKRPYVIDPKLAGGTISLDIDEEMTRNELIEFIGTLASLYDWAIEDRDGVLMFRAGTTRAKVPTSPVVTGVSPVDSEQMAVRVRKLRHAAPDQVIGVMKELMTTDSKQIAVGRMVVMADTTRQINRMSRLLAALDTPAFDGVSVWTYRLSTRTPEDAAKVLETIAQTSRINPGGQGADPLAAFVPVAGTDRLMVISRDPSLRGLVRTFVEQVDQPPEKTRRERYIYRVQNFEPDALQNFVTQAMPDKIEGGGAVPGTAPATGVKKPVRMVLEKSERILMVEATPEDYAEVLALIRAVDRPKMQVYINSTIAEVALTGQLEFGVNYFFQGDAVEKLGIFGLTASPGAVTGTPTGSIFFTGSGGLALVQAIQREAKVNILSQPRIYVTDGFKATINVGGSTPVATSSAETPAQDQGNTLSRTDIGYKDTGVKLEIKPKINESGLITLEITQENNVLAAPDTSTQAGTISPAFQTRKIVTNVTVPTGRTVIIGGMIDDRKEKRVGKVPILGDLPLIGPVFTTTFDRKDRTELLLTITPTIIPEPAETVTQMSDFLRAAEGVRTVFADSLDALPRGIFAAPEIKFFKGEPGEATDTDAAVTAPAAAPAPEATPTPAAQEPR